MPHYVTYLKEPTYLSSTEHPSIRHRAILITDVIFRNTDGKEEEFVPKGHSLLHEIKLPPAAFTEWLCSSEYCQSTSGTTEKSYFPPTSITLTHVHLFKPWVVGFYLCEEMERVLINTWTLTKTTLVPWPHCKALLWLSLYLNLICA